MFNSSTIVALAGNLLINEQGLIMWIRTTNGIMYIEVYQTVQGMYVAKINKIGECI